MTGSLTEKYERLQGILRRLERVAVAFSGGVDSTCVLKAAIDTLGAQNVVAVTGRSDSLARAELEEACALAVALGAEHVLIDTDEFENADYLKNPANRCYFCKTTLFQHMTRFLRGRGSYVIVSGTNGDDLGDYRPGLQAASEHDVRAPLAEAGLNKSDVRELSQRLGLPTSDKPASPCLSSRVPYGDAITPEKLRMIEAAESFLRRLGFGTCRVRHHGTIARIEVPADDFAAIVDPDIVSKIDAHLRELGYSYVALDLRGFRSGSLNELIPLSVRGST